MLAATMIQDDAFYRRVLDNLTFTALLFDASLCLSYVNSAGERLLGASARQLLGRPVDDLFPGSGQVRQLLGHVTASGETVTRRQLELDLPQGDRITADATATLMDGAGSEVLLELVPLDRFLRISRDASLVSQQDVARELMRGLAHEVKNPLGGLRGAAQLLERELDAAGKAALKEYTEVIIQEADRLQKLVDRMLGPSTRAEEQETNIHEVLERVRALVAAEAGPGVHVARDYDPSIPEVRADKGQLIQAVLNIARNAAQAVGAQGEIVFRSRILRNVTLGARRHRLAARIEIIDDGPGVPPELRDRLFYPMVTGRAEGTGLGLSIAQSLVQRHGGLIEFESAPGHTVFTILIPIDQASEEQS